MGQCYSVNLKINTNNEEKLIKAVQEYMESAYASFGNKYKPDSIDNIAKIFLAEEYGANFCTFDDHEYTSDFDGSYGWEGVLDNLWKVMKPYLTRGSYIEVWPDDGSWRYEI